MGWELEGEEGFGALGSFEDFDLSHGGVFGYFCVDWIDWTGLIGEEKTREDRQTYIYEERSVMTCHVKLEPHLFIREKMYALYAYIHTLHFLQVPSGCVEYRFTLIFHVYGSYSVQYAFLGWFWIVIRTYTNRCQKSFSGTLFVGSGYVCNTCSSSYMYKFTTNHTNRYKSVNQLCRLTDVCTLLYFCLSVLGCWRGIGIGIGAFEIFPLSLTNTLTGNSIASAGQEKSKALFPSFPVSCFLVSFLFSGIWETGSWIGYDSTVCM